MSADVSTGSSSGYRVSTRAVVVVGLLLALVLGGFVSYYASSHPDGLEYVAGEQGFLETAEDHRSSANSPLADYATEGVDNGRLSGGIAGVTGVALVLAISGGLAFALRRRDDGTGD